MRNILVIGASRGLGAAFALGLSEPGDRVWVVSRTRPEYVDELELSYIWIQADLRDPLEAARAIGNAVGETPLEVVLYNAGIWESAEFEEIEEEELVDIINVNLTALILCMKRVTGNIRGASDSRIFLSLYLRA